MQVNVLKSSLAVAVMLMLSACTTKTVTVEVTKYRQLDCPSVPQCIVRNTNIMTNKDLILAYADLKADFNKCKLARDTLQQCIVKSKNIAEKINSSGGSTITIEKESVPSKKITEDEK